jgi:hypothetical protein
LTGEGVKPDRILSSEEVVSPDGRRKASLVGARGIVAFDAGGGKSAAYLRGAAGPLRCLAWSLDGRVLLGAGDEGTVVAWDGLDGAELFRFPAHEAGVTCLAFSPNERLFATGSRDGTVLVWRLVGCVPPAGLEKLSRRDFPFALAQLDRVDSFGAFRHIQVLAADPETSVLLLREQLPPPLDPKQVDRWLSDLDADEFDRREKASAELAKLGRRIHSLLVRRLEDRPSAEVRHRIKDLLDQLGDGSQEDRGWSRRVQLLGQIGTPEAREVLRLLAEEFRVPAVADEAKAALRRH